MPHFWTLCHGHGSLSNRRRATNERSPYKEMLDLTWQLIKQAVPEINEGDEVKAFSFWLEFIDQTDEKVFCLQMQIKLSLALLYLVNLFINKLQTEFNNLFYRMILWMIFVMPSSNSFGSSMTGGLFLVLSRKYLFLIFGLGLWSGKLSISFCIGTVRSCQSVVWCIRSSVLQGCSWLSSWTIDVPCLDLLSNRVLVNSGAWCNYRWVPHC